MGEELQVTERLPVLIVEDNLLMRRILESSLHELGYRVVTAANGREALEILEQGYYPLVMTDWVMPEMDGIELCRAIRATERPGYTYIILLTAQHSPEDIVRGLDAGADEYLVKPINQAELRARLKTAHRILDLESFLKKSYEEIKILSTRDALTGVFNRRYMDEQLPHEIRRAERYGHLLSVVLGDIDYFKMINDTYGHATGDLVLQEYAAVLQNSIRTEIDWLARYGGEEFFVVLPETDHAGALVVAERFRRNVAEMTLATIGGEVSITSSFGVATWSASSPRQVIPPAELIGAADRCLYLAKRGGRNRVEGASLSDPAA